MTTEPINIRMITADSTRVYFTFLASTLHIHSYRRFLLVQHFPCGIKNRQFCYNRSPSPVCVSLSPLHFTLITQTCFGSCPDRSIPLPFMQRYFDDASSLNGIVLHLFSIQPLFYDCHPPLSVPLLSIPTSSSCPSLPPLHFFSPSLTHHLPPSTSNIPFLYGFIHRLSFTTSALFFPHPPQKCYRRDFLHLPAICPFPSYPSSVSSPQISRLNLSHPFIFLVWFYRPNLFKKKRNVIFINTQACHITQARYLKASNYLEGIIVKIWASYISFNVTERASNFLDVLVNPQIMY